MEIPATIPIWNLLTAALGAIVAFIWRTLNEKIMSECTRVETRAMNEIRGLEDRFARFETQVNNLPSQLDALKQQLQRIELQLASTHVTKSEMKEVEAARSARMDRLEMILENLIEKQSSPRRPAKR